MLSTRGIFHVSLNFQVQKWYTYTKEKKHRFYKNSQLQIKNVLVSCNSVWLYNRKCTNKLLNNILYLDTKLLNSNKGEYSCLLTADVWFSSWLVLKKKDICSLILNTCIKSNLGPKIRHFSKKFRHIKLVRY